MATRVRSSSKVSREKSSRWANARGGGGACRYSANSWPVAVAVTQGVSEAIGADEKHCAGAEGHGDGIGDVRERGSGQTAEEIR